jgi:uncharacterized protein YjiK
LYKRLFATWHRSESRAGSKTSAKRSRLKSIATYHCAVERLEERRLLAVASLVQTINTFEFSPPSPDPAGIIYLPTSDTLLIADSEVNEMPIFTGDNLFESTLSGSLVNSSTTTHFSDEPSGIAFNPENGHLFFSDDTGARRIYELDPASDGLYGTADDIVTSFRTARFGSSDPEGVAYDFQQGRLFVADGVDERIYEVSPGSNGVFDGVAPDGDDQVTSFDVSVLGLSDPEGLAFNWDNGHLYAVGEPVDTLFEITTNGGLVQLIDISAANARKTSGVAYGPSSNDLDEMSVYITDRGTDNDRDPNENDGQIFEMSIGPPDSGPLTVCSVSTQDIFIRQDRPDENYGRDKDLKVKPDSGKTHHILAEFNVTVIPPNSHVIDATMMLYEDNHKDNQTIFVHRVTSDWLESQVTWDESSTSTSWITAGGDFDTTAVASFAPDIDGQYREIDVTDVTQDWVNGTSANHGLLLRSTGANGEVKFKSKEEGDSDKHPKLCVTYEVSPPVNQSPTVHAGYDQTIVFPASAMLDATVTDDGLPNPPGTVETTWTQVSGPGTVTFGDSSAMDTAASFSAVGTYVVRLTANDGELVANDEVTIIVTDSNPTVPILYFAYNEVSTFPGGLNVSNEDIVSFDGIEYTMVFDGSDLGLSGLQIDAIDILDADEILISFTSSASLPGISGTVDDSDIVKFTATQLGDSTAGSFELFFDGSDVGLGVSAEDVDGIELLDDGRVLISTSGNFSVAQLTGQGEDILALTPTSLGETTAGSWSLYFDGNDVGLTGAGVDGLSVGGNGAIYLTSKRRFDVPGLSGKDEDVFVFYPSSLGENTAGAYDLTLMFDGSLQGLSHDLKAIDVTSTPIITAPSNFIPVAGDALQLVDLGRDILDPRIGNTSVKRESSEVPQEAPPLPPVTEQALPDQLQTSSITVQAFSTQNPGSPNAENLQGQDSSVDQMLSDDSFFDWLAGIANH